MPPPTPRQPWWRRWFGSRSERAAERFLRRLGYQILTRNYSCPLGEIDLIVQDRDCLVFVEVRSTEGADPGVPAASVDDRKQHRLTQLALSYLQKKRLLDASARFDVLAISWPANQKNPNIVHYVNAFPAVGRFQMGY